MSMCLQEEIWHLAPKRQRHQTAVQLGPRFDRVINEIVQVSEPLWKSLQREGEKLVPSGAAVVCYSAENRARIATHVDTCDMTLNICLQQCRKGGDLKFFLPEAGWTIRHRHEVGGAVALRGYEIPHGTYPVREGERVTLAIQFNAAVDVKDTHLQVQFAYFFKLPAILQQLVLIAAGASCLQADGNLSCRGLQGLWHAHVSCEAVLLAGR